MVGRIHADVWIQTDLPDVDVFVRMTDVYPEAQGGKSMLMAQGIQRARYRNGVCPQPLPSSTPTLVRVDLKSTALVWPADHKIRVIVSAAAGPSYGGMSTYPLYSINPQNGDEYVGTHPNRTGTINVLFGGTHASALYIPVLTASGTPPPDRRPNTTPCPF
jgi:predicted acyl esterase